MFAFINRVFFVLLISLISINSFAQTEQLDDLLTWLASNVGEESSDGYTYDQTWSNDPFIPGMVRVDIVEKDTKDKTTSYRYEFHLADVDPASIKRNFKGETFKVEISLHKGDDFIKSYKDGALKNYVNNFEIHVKDATAANLLINKISQASSLSQSGTVTWKSKDAAVAWLEEYIKQANLDDEIVGQQFICDKKDDNRIKYREFVTGGKGKTSEESWEFYFYDLDPDKVKIDVKGDEMRVKLEIKGGDDYVKYWENEEVKNWDDEVYIVVDQVELARNIVNAFQFIIPLEKRTIYEWSSVQQVVDWTNSAMSSAVTGKESLGLEWNYSPVKHKIEIEAVNTAKGKPDPKEYTFYLPHLKDKKIDFEISGSELLVKLQMPNKEHWIATKDDKGVYSYSDEIEIPVTNLRDARHFVEGWKFACKQVKEYEKKWNSVPDIISFMNAELKDYTEGNNTISREIEYQALVDHKITITREEVDKKAAKELQVFESFLLDYDTKSAQLKTSSNRLWIEITTKKGDKVIKYTKDGEVQSHVNTIELDVQDAQIGMELVSAFHQAVSIATGMPLQQPIKEDQPEQEPNDPQNDPGFIQENTNSKYDMPYFVEDKEGEELQHERVQNSEGKNAQEIYNIMETWAIAYYKSADFALKDPAGQKLMKQAILVAPMKDGNAIVDYVIYLASKDGKYRVVLTDIMINYKGVNQPLMQAMDQSYAQELKLSLITEFDKVLADLHSAL